MKSYVLGANRILLVSDGVIIKDTVTLAEAEFTPVRWHAFVSYIDDIDAEVKKLTEGENEFRYCQSYGGGWQVFVPSGFRCVDLRRFYLNNKDEVKPTRHGIALRLHEWQTLKDIVRRIQEDVGATCYCCHDIIHGWLQCRECFPFIRRFDSTTRSQSSTSHPNGPNATTEMHDGVPGPSTDSDSNGESTNSRLC